MAAPDADEPPAPPPPPKPIPAPVDRSSVIGEGVKATAAWSLRLIVIGVALVLLFWLVGKIWVGVRPIVLALILSTVLWPSVSFLRRHRFPPALASSTVLVAALLLIGGVFAAIAQPMVNQIADLVDSAVSGIEQLRDWLTGPPINLESARIDTVTSAVIDRLRSSATQIAAGLVSGVSAVTSVLVNFLLVLVLTFFFVKDGPKFLPWLRRETGRTIGSHLTEVFARSWKTLSDFIRVQAIVSLVDAALIGLGLLILGVPLVAALAVLTFFAGFIPIVGALAAGGLAVLVALVSNGPTTALLVAALILVVQQIESSVLQPVLQGRSLNLHAAIVLLAVTAGATLFGISGAFLAVPVTAVAVAVLRYISEQISLRAGEVHADDLNTATPEGGEAARQSEEAGRHFRQLIRRRSRGGGRRRS